MRALHAIAVAAIMAASATSSPAGEIYMTPAEKAAPTVDGYLDKSGELFYENEKDKGGKPWLYVKVRDPETGALYAIRIVFKRDADGKSHAQTRLLIDPRALGSRASR